MRIKIDFSKEKNIYKNWIERKHVKIFSNWNWDKSIRQNYNESSFMDRLIVDLHRKYFKLSKLKKRDKQTRIN